VPAKKSPESPKVSNEGDFKIDLSFDRTVSFDFEAPKKKQTPGAAMGLEVGTFRNKTRHRCYDLSRVPNAVKLIAPLPAPGETVHAIMGGDFHAWDLVPAIHGLLGCAIAEIYITTLGFNHGNNRNLCDMLEQGAIGRAFVLCSEYFRDADRDVYDEAERQLEARGAKLRAVRNHSKIICIAPAGRRDRYTLESSANLRSCNNVEQFALTNDPGLHNFHRGWIKGQFQ
jgi:hypothetical protein